MKPTCGVGECPRPATQHGWCLTHYRRWRKNGEAIAHPILAPPMTTLVLEDFDTKHLVSANKKLHYQRAGAVRAYWRRLGHDLIVDEYGYADVGETWHQRVRIVATLRWPNKIRRDDHNYYSYVIKPIVDGLVDARLIPDDNDRHLVGPDVRRDPERGPHRIALRIEDAL